MILEHLRAGLSAREMLGKLIGGDTAREVRRIGIVDKEGRTSVHTGADCVDWAGHIEGGGFTVQGNMPVGAATIEAMAEAATGSEALPLHERLMLALEAGQAAGECPEVCLVGEPTGMGVVIGHKGGRGYRCRVRGSEAHSSLAPRAVNAIEVAADLIVFIRRLAAELAKGACDPDCDVVHSTISTGLIEGGTAINIVPKDCAFTFEFRSLIDVDPQTIADRIIDYATDLLQPATRTLDPACGIAFEEICNDPAHAIDAGHPLVTRLKSTVGSKAHAKVAFGTEAGLFRRDLGVPTVVCGPGFIGVAQRPDEYVGQSRLDACDAALARLLL